MIKKSWIMEGTETETEMKFKIVFTNLCSHFFINDAFAFIMNSDKIINKKEYIKYNNKVMRLAVQFPIQWNSNNFLYSVEK